MPTITLRNVPEDLHRHLKQQAKRHHRSVNREVIILLETLLEKPAKNEITPEERLSAIMEISRRCAALPELDPRSTDKIIGYDENGLPA
ncbi:MAG: Arc family DNA-binding protein [Candidatus Competibacteraceae bacterium]